MRYDSPTPGYVHHDRVKHAPHVDLAWDLRRYPWPFTVTGNRVAIPDAATKPPVFDIRSMTMPPPGEVLDEILALDVFEHVSVEVQPWLDECWRLLKPDDGLLDIRLPCWDNPLSYRDPTHLRVYHRESFYYWDPDHGLHESFGSFYFGESARWWKVDEIFRENGDWRYRLRKRRAAVAATPNEDIA